jgi:8-oxo-dGTP pyrophosphatase MutT (NUDIX family)
MKRGIVRPIAICVFSRNGRILVAEGYDPVKQQTFYRPLGGAIEFGEPAAATIARELSEELGATVANLRYIGTLENIFTYAGEIGHEIVIIFDGEFADLYLYDQESLEGIESDGSQFRTRWLRLSDSLNPINPPLYPTGLSQLLSDNDAEIGR